MACLAGLLIRSTAWQDDGTGHKEGLESGKLPRALGCRFVATASSAFSTASANLCLAISFAACCAACAAAFAGYAG